MKRTCVVLFIYILCTILLNIFKGMIMNKIAVGDRVRIKMDDANGNPLYGTVVDNNFMGFAVLVSCDTPVSKQYCYTDDKEVMFSKDNVEKV